MEVLNQNAIEINETEEVGGAIACIMACGGVCLLTGTVGAAFATAASLV